MAKFSYIDKSGKSAFVDAADANEAMRIAPNIASNSGVALETASPVNTPNVSVDSGKTSTGTPNVASAGASGDPFLDKLKERLLGSSAIVSSADGLESKISDAIGKINESNNAGKKRIISEYDRQISDSTKIGENSVVGALENRSGFGTVTAVIRNAAETAQKNVKDLEMRRNELLLAGDANAASEISKMIIQEYQFEQQARQQGFANLLGLANFGVSSLEADIKKKQLEGAGAMQASDIETFTDTSGNVVAKNKLTGQTLWTAKGIGRAGQVSSANYTVTPIADPNTGNVMYTQIQDPKSGTIRYVDNTGKDVDPSTVQIKNGKDALDQLIDDAIGGITSGLYSE